MSRKSISILEAGEFYNQNRESIPQNIIHFLEENGEWRVHYDVVVFGTKGKEPIMNPEFSKFLNPDNFVTHYDSLPHNIEYAKEQYSKGLSIGNQAKKIHISITDSWSASMLNNSYISAYERIGQHACSKDLLRGFLDSSVAIIVYRDIDNEVESCIIKTAKE